VGEIARQLAADPQINPFTANVSHRRVLGASVETDAGVWERLRRELWDGAATRDALRATSKPIGLPAGAAVVLRRAVVLRGAMTELAALPMFNDSKMIIVRWPGLEWRTSDDAAQWRRSRSGCRSRRT
jgi:hypothetical protein